MEERRFRQQIFMVLLVIFALCFEVIEEGSRNAREVRVCFRQELHLAWMQSR